MEETDFRMLTKQIMMRSIEILLTNSDSVNCFYVSSERFPVGNDQLFDNVVKLVRDAIHAKNYTGAVEIVDEYERPHVVINDLVFDCEAAGIK